jgi:DNA polymerase-4
MPPPPQKQIAHLDLDCFYVSVERIKNPALNGKPVVVGGTPTGRGVVASASYEARAFGVRSAMPTGQALRLCPSLSVVRGDYRAYKDYSDRLYRRMLDFAPIVERASIDEMYMDFTGCKSLYQNDLPRLMQELKQIVWDDFNLPCTIALASNKTIAKIAAGTVKPNGLCVIPHGMEKPFLAPLPIEVIPGVGKKTEAFLKKKGFRTVADLQAVSLQRLEELLGAHGVWLHRVVHGGGSEIVHPEHVRKSISQEETFARDTSNRAELESILFSLVEGVCSTLRSRQWMAGTVTVKIRSSDFKTITHARTITPTNDDPEVFRVTKELLSEGYEGNRPLRLLGVRLSNFINKQNDQPLLFPQETKRSQVLNAVDSLRKKFGDDVIHVGGV